MFSDCTRDQTPGAHTVSKNIHNPGKVRGFRRVSRQVRFQLVLSEALCAHLHTSPVLKIAHQEEEQSHSAPVNLPADALAPLVAQKASATCPGGALGVGKGDVGQHGAQKTTEGAGGGINAYCYREQRQVRPCYWLATQPVNEKFQHIIQCMLQRWYCASCRCKPKKCRQECKKSCPVVRTGEWAANIY